ncbi:hypothetical protein P8452_07269 [Trifolium repens]|nr:hypothetical protein P8452_07269 [Trifolium repens]
MAQKQKIFMLALMMVLLLSSGINKTEGRQVVVVKCIGTCPGFHDCEVECKHKGYTHGGCLPPKYYYCCCST